MRDTIQELAEEFDLDLEGQPDGFTDSEGVDGIEMEAREAAVIQPFQPDEGVLKNETHNFVLDDGDQLSITVKHRPECPSCGHVLAEEDEPNTLAGECTICNQLTCHRNQSKCEGCNKVFCPEHASGHGLKDNSYCEDCLEDVEEDLSFERGMEERQQEHSEEMEKLDKRLKEEKQRKELELKEVRQQREQIRKDWNTVIQLLDRADQDQSSAGNDSDGASFRDGGGLTDGTGFEGSGAFTEGKEYSNRNNSGDERPDWLKDQFDN
ncbi:hypothetical protein SAMN05443574_103313 [Haloarcula vallismortis]|uniref:Uncharacterized protein n=2 Tax=Haloarcula vallismortis TaxID=28442 RepID=M0JRJ0_HALVA|nr:hypothetical protein [Haloarcula vallismortis]EMA11576.1 hypothetical protein C437_01650 [Haloarcula vallismortis ATCC 29715]SDW45319.1 hypothetical protein SAMN05443574_103313 [Haloarcula vallismortis]